MSVITSTRNQQTNIIEQNPASIVITRTAKVSDGAGGYTTSTPTLDSQDIRIYSKRTRILTIDDGGYHFRVPLPGINIEITLTFFIEDNDIDTTKDYVLKFFVD